MTTNHNTYKQEFIEFETLGDFDRFCMSPEFKTENFEYIGGENFRIKKIN